MATRDHPDWWRPIGGQNSQDSTLERRSLMWNDDGIEDDTVPDNIYEAEVYKGKFFTRGCRGMLEQIQLYCIGDGADEITLRYSPHPCLGPIGELTIVPAAAWAWQDFNIEEMWDYDSLFIWVVEAEVNVDWAYDAELPYDGHESADTGATWSDMAIRPFIRVVYTGETPGDVPVSGIINNIPIPGSSSTVLRELRQIPEDVETTLVDIHGIGYCDTIELTVYPTEHAEDTTLRVYCDENLSFQAQPEDWSFSGYTPNTPTFSLTNFVEGARCDMLLTKMFEFRRRFRVTIQNNLNGVLVDLFVYPTLLR